MEVKETIRIVTIVAPNSRLTTILQTETPISVKESLVISPPENLDSDLNTVAFSSPFKKLSINPDNRKEVTTDFLIHFINSQLDSSEKNANLRIADGALVVVDMSSGSYSLHSSFVGFVKPYLYRALVNTKGKLE